MTASSIRRKEKMIEIKKKKKEKKNATRNAFDDHEESLDFKSIETVPFGATNLRPPELKAYAEKITARMTAKKLKSQNDSKSEVSKKQFHLLLPFLHFNLKLLFLFLVLFSVMNESFIIIIRIMLIFSRVQVVRLIIRSEFC